MAYETSNDDINEPKLKYERLGNDLYPILNKDSLSCFALHEKFLAIGTSWGLIYILDHMGNKIQVNDLAMHSSTVNQICFDLAGEYVGSCSHDGRVIINGLYSSQHNFSQRFDIDVKCLAINPFYGKDVITKLYVTGIDKVVMFEKALMGKRSYTLFSGGFGCIQNLKWFKNYIVWNDDKAVKIYDLDSNSIIGSVLRESYPLKITYSCFFKWYSNAKQPLKDKLEYDKQNDETSSLVSNSNSNETRETSSLTSSISKQGNLLSKYFKSNLNNLLIIGWYNTIRICQVTVAYNSSKSSTYNSLIAAIPTSSLLENISSTLTGSTTVKYVQILQSFTTHFYICGLTPYPNIENIAVLAYPKEGFNEVLGSENEALLPVAEVVSAEEVCEFPQNSIPESQEYQRPQLHIITPKSENLYQETVNDALSTKDWKFTQPQQYILDYNIDENLLYICSPKDIVLGRPRTSLDHVHWLIERGHLKSALQASFGIYLNIFEQKTKESNKSNFKTHLPKIIDWDQATEAICNVFKVAKIYTDDLISNGHFETAAKDVIHNYYRYPFENLVSLSNADSLDTCSTGHRAKIQTLLQEIWTDALYKFVKAHKLRQLLLLDDDFNLGYINLPPLNINNINNNAIVNDSNYVNMDNKLKYQQLPIEVSLEAQCYHLVFGDLLGIIPGPNNKAKPNDALYVVHGHQYLYELIKRLPIKLYDANLVINIIRDCLKTNAADEILTKSLALLYSNLGDYSNAIALNIKIGQLSDVFKLIVDHNLHQEMIKEPTFTSLIKLDESRTLDLLIEFRDKISIDFVAKKLESMPQTFLKYLDNLFVKDSNFSKIYHGQQVKLYAKYEPSKLLHFLKNSQHYNLQKALEDCKTHKMYPEIHYLYNRTGNRTKALAVLVNDMKDIEAAITYCKNQTEDSTELWSELIKMAIHNSDFVGVMLRNMGSFMDPLELIQNIEPGMKILGLRDSLVKILRDYRLQTDLRDSCNRILINDAAQLFREKYNLSNRAFTLVTGQTNLNGILNDNFNFEYTKDQNLKCCNCRQSLCVSPYQYQTNASLTEGNFPINSDGKSIMNGKFKDDISLKGKSRLGSGDNVSSEFKQPKRAQQLPYDIKIFYCKHAFHSTCVASDSQGCPVCSSISQSFSIPNNAMD